MRHGYGVTTFDQAIAVSTVVRIGGEKNVVDTVFMGATGSVVSMSGVSSAISGSIIAAGCELRNDLNPLHIQSAEVFLAPDGGASVLQIMQLLSAGFSGNKGTLNGE